MADVNRQASNHQAVRGLLVNAPGIAHRARQHATQPAVGAFFAALAEALFHAHRAHEFGGCAGEIAYRFAAAHQPLIRIEHQMPVGVGHCQCGIAGRRKVVAPGELADGRTVRPRNVDRGIERAGIKHAEPVYPGCHAGEQSADTRRFVAGDDHQRDRMAHRNRTDTDGLPGSPS